MEITPELLKCARSDFQRSLLTEMCTIIGAIRPLAQYPNPKAQIASLNSLCTRVTAIPNGLPDQSIPQFQVYCLTDLPNYVCLRINNPYPHTENYIWTPTLIQLLTWHDYELMEELCFEPEDILTEVLGSHYHPEEFEDMRPFNEDMVPWKLKCQHCPHECELVEEEYINSSGKMVAICNSCRAKGIQPTDMQPLTPIKAKEKTGRGFRW